MEWHSHRDRAPPRMAQPQGWGTGGDGTAISTGHQQGQHSHEDRTPLRMAWPQGCSTGGDSTATGMRHWWGWHSHKDRALARTAQFQDQAGGDHSVAICGAGQWQQDGMQCSPRGQCAGSPGAAGRPGAPAAAGRAGASRGGACGSGCQCGAGGALRPPARHLPQRLLRQQQSPQLSGRLCVQAGVLQVPQPRQQALRLDAGHALPAQEPHQRAQTVQVLPSQLRPCQEPLQWGEQRSEGRRLCPPAPRAGVPALTRERRAPRARAAWRVAGRASRLRGWRFTWSRTACIMASGSISTSFALREPEHSWAPQGEGLLCPGTNGALSPILQTPSHSRGAQAPGRGWRQGWPRAGQDRGCLLWLLLPVPTPLRAEAQGRAGPLATRGG